MNFSTIAKYLIFLGIAIIIVGLVVLAIGKLGIPLGKLPGDIHIKKEKLGIYFPIVTSIVISIVLTVIVNLIVWFLRK